MPVLIADWMPAMNASAVLRLDSSLQLDSVSEYSLTWRGPDIVAEGSPPPLERSLAEARPDLISAGVLL